MPNDDRSIPADPRAQPIETVEALEDRHQPATEDEQAVPVEDVTENPGTEELEELPGPSEEQPNESAG